MPIVTFWSNNEKTIGQTVAISMSAAIMAIDHNYKILLMSADPNDVSVEGCFGAQESNRELIKTLIRKPQIGLDSGINGLLKLSDSNRVTPEAIHDYTKIVFKNRLEVLYSPMNILDEKKASLMQELKNIMINASKYYDYVFVDLQKGLKSASQLEILELSDVIVANMDQGTKTIEQFLAIKEIQTLRNKVIWNICKYDNKSKYNIKNLTRTILKKQQVYETRYNTLVLDAAQEGNIADLLLRLKTLKGEDENSLMLSKVEELNEGILLKYQETRTKM